MYFTQSKYVKAIHGAPTYVDVFAGCGGLSLGLERAGWHGLFAIEKDKHAFSTLSDNFLEENSRFHYCWPEWLPKQPWTVEEILRQYNGHLLALRGKIDLLAGGPPCQGFSSAGRRHADDPRNAMVERYLDLVDALEPRVLLLENVRGFALDFKAGRRKVQENAAAQLTRKLSVAYEVQSAILKASDFGVPQTRPRFILIGVRREANLPSGALNDLRVSRALVLQKYGLSTSSTAKDAISDLEISRNHLIACADSPKFEAIGYVGPSSAFQKAMRDGFEAAPSDTRLAKHCPRVRERFAEIIEMSRNQGQSNQQISVFMREQLGLRKLTTRVLDPDQPAPTITSMPDDLLHYSEPRTLTVRENARLQTFPDWFIFRGKYTTGGRLRRLEVPRFTQVANAVPPLLAEVLGDRIMRHCLEMKAVSAIS
ncbi:DNA (cytosine-5)-methyltransferase 1 [Skermanella aerolata]|uniref:DNA cytosine methyltransferase n=1 Tax=Skermanella aerolata TaxID=393310 RepID=UPI003D19A925